MYNRVRIESKTLKTPTFTQSLTLEQYSIMSLFCHLTRLAQQSSYSVSKPGNMAEGSAVKKFLGNETLVCCQHFYLTLNI